MRTWNEQIILYYYRYMSYIRYLPASPVLLSLNRTIRAPKSGPASLPCPAMVGGGASSKHHQVRRRWLKGGEVMRATQVSKAFTVEDQLRFRWVTNCLLCTYVAADSQMAYGLVYCVHTTC